MAQKVITQLIDDLDGTELSSGEGETVRFAVDGTSYDIDLSRDKADDFRNALAPYVAKARKANDGGRRSGRRAAGDTRRDPAQTRHIRQWAQAQGHQVNDRGRIPAEVVAAYEAAH